MANFVEMKFMNEDEQKTVQIVGDDEVSILGFGILKTLNSVTTINSITQY